MQPKHRMLSLALAGALCAASTLYATPALTSAASAPSAAPSLTGLWAMMGTGPAGLVNKAGRIATITIKQQGHTLSATLRSGTAHYAVTGTFVSAGAKVSLKWHMSKAGDVRFSGTLLANGTRIIGLWNDAHGDDGGAILSRTTK